jgi:hypothetical protein
MDAPVIFNNILSTTDIIELTTTTQQASDTVPTSVGLVSAIILLVIIIVIVVCRCRYAKHRHNSDVSQATDPESNSTGPEPTGSVFEADGHMTLMDATKSKTTVAYCDPFEADHWALIDPQIKTLACQVMVDRECIALGRILGKGDTQGIRDTDSQKARV